MVRVEPASQEVASGPASGSDWEGGPGAIDCWTALHGKLPAHRGFEALHLSFWTLRLLFQVVNVSLVLDDCAIAL